MKRLSSLTPLVLMVFLTGCSNQGEESASAIPSADHQPAEVVITVAAGRSGEQIYQRHCQACHDPGAGHPATLLLGLKYGADKALIKGRQDLNADYIKTIVRGGLLEMPPFRPTEISDGELELIAEFVLTP